MPARRPASPSARRPAPRPSARGGAARAASSRSTTQPKAGRPAPPRQRTTANGSVPASARGSGVRAMLNRPAGPAREARRRGHNGLVLPEVLTVRLLVLAVVLLIAVVVLVPTVRAAVQQSVALHQLRNDLAASQAESDRLQRELDRWDDPAYVESQARERMHFVMPGDKVWRTIGGDTVVDDVDPVTGKPVDAGVVGTDAGKDEPWYSALWESVRVADGPATAAGSTPTPTPSPTPSASRTPSAAP